MSTEHAAHGNEPEYARQLASLFPPQGLWSESEYLELTDTTNRRVEFVNGKLDFLPKPTEVHEALVRFLFLGLYRFVDQGKLGEVYSNGIRLRVPSGRIRLPDVIFLAKENFSARHNWAWEGADLVIEVVSERPGDRQRDCDDKLVEYAEAAIAEYWIIDLAQRIVRVNQLKDHEYAVRGEFTTGQRATSVLLAGFQIDVDELFAVADNIPD